MKHVTLIVVLGVTVAVAADTRAQNPARSDATQHPDHQEHSFADVERYSKAFDDPTRDEWQMPDRVIAALGLTQQDFLPRQLFLIYTAN